MALSSWSVKSQFNWPVNPSLMAREPLVVARVLAEMRRVAGVRPVVVAVAADAVVVPPAVVER
jgi:hypothetical protein